MKRDVILQRPAKNRSGSQALSRGYLDGALPQDSNLLALCHYLNVDSVMPAPFVLLYCPLERNVYPPNLRKYQTTQKNQTESFAPEPLMLRQQ